MKMVTEIFKIDASWAEKLTITRVQFLLTPTVTQRLNVVQVRQAIRDKYGIEKPVREDDDYDIDEDDKSPEETITTG